MDDGTWSALGFRPEPFEKAIHVLELLDALCRHPFLKERVVLPLQEHELELLTRLNDSVEIETHLLTHDETMRNINQTQPTLHWKAENVRQYKQGSE